MNNKKKSEFSLYKVIPKIAKKKHSSPAIYEFLVVLETLELNIQNIEVKINNLEQKVQDFLQK